MTELQKIELDMLKAFVNVCDTLHLRYYLVCGSALGAAKYKGFIPWDDDLDVGLFREDYETFLEKAPSLLPRHIVVQNHRTDPRFPQIYTKLRHSQTTYIEKSSRRLDIHHGVYIDVFPLDGYPTDSKQADCLERLKKTTVAKMYTAYDLPRKSFRAKAAHRWRRLLGCHRRTAMYARMLNEAFASYSTQVSHTICNHGNWQGKLEYAPKEQYGDGVWAEFEGLRVRIPEKYDEYLTQKYGDWRADLPEDQQIGHHFYEVCDLHRPYTAYVEKLSNGKIRLKKSG